MKLRKDSKKHEPNSEETSPHASPVDHVEGPGRLAKAQAGTKTPPRATNLSLRIARMHPFLTSIAA
jgi:hypothetical protein